MVIVIDFLAEHLRFGLVNMLYLELAIMTLIGRIDSKTEANVKTIQLCIAWLRIFFLLYWLVELWLFELIEIAIEHVLRLLPSSLLCLIFPLAFKHILEGLCILIDFFCMFAVYLCQACYLCMNSFSTIDQLLHSTTVVFFEEIRDFLNLSLCDFVHFLLQVFLVRNCLHTLHTSLGFFSLFDYILANHLCHSLDGHFDLDWFILFLRSAGRLMTHVLLVAFGSHRLVLNPRVEHTRLIACVSGQCIGAIALSVTFFIEAKSIILVWVLLPLCDDFFQFGLCGSTLSVVPLLVLEELFEGQVLGDHFSNIKYNDYYDAEYIHQLLLQSMKKSKFIKHPHLYPSRRSTTIVTMHKKLNIKYSLWFLRMGTQFPLQMARLPIQIAFYFIMSQKQVRWRKTASKALQDIQQDISCLQQRSERQLAELRQSLEYCLHEQGQQHYLYQALLDISIDEMSRRSLQRRIAFRNRAIQFFDALARLCWSCCQLIILLKNKLTKLTNYIPAKSQSKQVQETEQLNDTSDLLHISEQ